MTRKVHLVAMLGELELSPDEVRELKSVEFMHAVQTVGAFKNFRGIDGR